MADQVATAKSDTRLQVVLQAFITSSIVASAGFICDDYAVVREIFRASAPFFALLSALAISYFIRMKEYEFIDKHNMDNYQKSYDYYENETNSRIKSVAKTRLEYWEKVCHEHRANNRPKILS